MSSEKIRKPDKAIKKSLITSVLLTCSILVGGCSKGDVVPSSSETTTEPPVITTAATTPDGGYDFKSAVKNPTHERPDVKPNGDVVILMTGDTHSGIDKGFGYGGVYEVRYQMELKGDTVLLVDTGDAIQGDPVGYNTKGDAIIDLMNDCGYDLAIPGVREFHYGMDNFMKLASKANYDYISCNFVKNGETVFKPYVIKEVCGRKIAFVGVSTPKTLTQEPAEYFQDENGNQIYGFMEDEKGEAVAQAVQQSIDKARAEGAEYVILMGHLGNELEAAPWNYMSITLRTHGYDAYFDGYSHDLKSEDIIDSTGKTIKRISAGSYLTGLGWVRISAKDGSVTAGLHSWSGNKVNPTDLFDIVNPMTKKVKAARKQFGTVD